MRLFDTHCHLDFDVFGSDLEAHLQLAREKRVERFLVPSIGKQNWQKVFGLANAQHGVYTALGCHPYFLSSSHLDDLIQLERLLNQKAQHCVA